MLTHIDPKNLPTMVDVSDKATTVRTARAETKVVLPLELKKYLVVEELMLKKGPVFQTAIIAGTMAVKKTFEMIPFCHQVPIEASHFNITMDEDLVVTIECEVKTSYKTGVEMEALHGSLMAAMTIYDMCKAVSHNIIIKETRLVHKTGGKRAFLNRPVYGLILTGGKSLRMERDKALISYKGLPHAQYLHQVLSLGLERVFLSSKKDQWQGSPLENLPTIHDEYDHGPIGGMLSAFEKYPDVNWMVVACDLVHFGPKTYETLITHYDENAIATCFKNSEKGFPEALCALYTPKAHDIFKKALNEGVTCPVKVLKQSDCKLIEAEGEINLANINTPEEFASLS